MKQFEYRVFSCLYNDPNYMEKEFNKLGNQGWELVALKGEYKYLFKREINKKEDLV